jgi:adenylosuccinate lyase
MAANVEALGGVVHSGEVLLALTQAGMTREEAYAAVQRNAMATWTKLGTAEGRSFRETLLADPAVAARLDAAAIDRAMDSRRHLRHVDTVLARVFGSGEAQPGDVDGG